MATGQRLIITVTGESTQSFVLPSGRLFLLPFDRRHVAIHRACVPFMTGRTAYLRSKRTETSRASFFVNHLSAGVVAWDCCERRDQARPQAPELILHHAISRPWTTSSRLRPPPPGAFGGKGAGSRLSRR